MVSKPKAAIAEALAAAQAQLAEMVRELEAGRFRLLGVEASLPPAPMEVVDLMEEDVMDARTQMRAAIQHVLDAYFEPATRELRRAASPENP